MSKLSSPVTIHSHGLIELAKGFTLPEADDNKFDIRNLMLRDPDIVDVTFGILEEDAQQNLDC